MTKEKRKLTARKIQNFYLYPSRSKGENLARGSVWMVSWLIGIITQQATSQQALGGAYLIFALSLLLEFLPENKEYLLPKVIHGVFYILLLIMLLGSAVLSFWKIPNEQAKETLPYQLFVTPLPYIGWIVFTMISIGAILALSEIDKFFYDEKIEARGKKEKKAEYVDRQECFKEKLGVPKEGGDT